MAGMTGRARALALIALLPALAGCGGGGGGGDESMPSAAAKAGGDSGSPGATARADTASVRAIRGWVDSERQNRMRTAAGYFSLPAIVLNGGQPLLLSTRAEVVIWNAALPCGAKLVRAVDVRGWTIARFRLMSRKGGNCDGIGNTASTAFALRKGKIALWIRVRDDVSPAEAAPPHAPDREFLRTGRVRGHPAPTPDELGNQGPSV
jgi:hypothetical protein